MGILEHYSHNLRPFSQEWTGAECFFSRPGTAARLPSPVHDYGMLLGLFPHPSPMMLHTLLQRPFFVFLQKTVLTVQKEQEKGNVIY